jgi:nitroreductase
MEVSSAIRTKRAVRKFADQPLPEESIQSILNAGRRAQSAKNLQPWHFIAIQDHKSLVALSKLGHFAGHLAGAALGIAIITPPPEQRFSVLFDAGQSAAYMQLAAWELGIGSCLATIYEPSQARKILRFPDEYHINIIISFGFPQNPHDISRPPGRGGRRSWDDVVHWEVW